MYRKLQVSAADHKYSSMFGSQQRKFDPLTYSHSQPAIPLWASARVPRWRHVRRLDSAVREFWQWRHAPAATRPPPGSPTRKPRRESDARRTSASLCDRGTRRGKSLSTGILIYDWRRNEKREWSNRWTHQNPSTEKLRGRMTQSLLELWLKLEFLEPRELSLVRSQRNCARM